MKKISTIDLFAGCGGLTEGFAQSGYYETKACVEWEPAPCANLEKRLHDKWGCCDASERVVRFDIQRTDELLHGFDDPLYGQSKGLDALAGKVDLIIGGPPCQAYSIAGRIRDENGMKNDYRNFLFESYLEVVKHFKPKAFVFENVPGILSAKPGDTPIVDLIRTAFSKAGYEIIPDFKDAVIDFTKYGVPQRRKRIIILGLRKDVYGTTATLLLRKFYTETLPAQKTSVKTVRDAIGDLPALIPLAKPAKAGGRKYSHSFPAAQNVANHYPRFHNNRDIQTFHLLEQDIESGRYQYTSVEALKQVYTIATGKTSGIHKYNVLRWDEPSNTIPAHLYKDGLRHIHPDSRQARSITVREAARLQTFPDDYIFVGSQMDQFKMIGNAVSPEFARKLALAIYDLLFNSEANN